jgi:DNA-binding Lrp family transcriptional regulator
LTKKTKYVHICSTVRNKSEHSYIRVREAEAALHLKNNAMALDGTDLRILEALQEDGRQTYTAIGKRLGIAHSTVYDRIKRMEQHGIIKKYTAVIDVEKAGAKSLTAIMTIYTDPKESEKVAEKLCKTPQVLEVYTSLSEELLIIAKVVAEDQENLHNFIADSVAPLPGVLRIRTSIVTKKFKEAQFLISNETRKVIFNKETDNRIGEKKP